MFYQHNGGKKIPVIPLTDRVNPPDPGLFISKKKKKKKKNNNIYSALPYEISGSAIFLWKFVEIIMWARDDKITPPPIFAVAVVDLPHICVELALLFLHRSVDNNFEDIIKSFLHLFAVQS